MRPFFIKNIFLSVISSLVFIGLTTDYAFASKKTYVLVNPEGKSNARVTIWGTKGNQRIGDPVVESQPINKQTNFVCGESPTITDCSIKFTDPSSFDIFSTTSGNSLSTEPLFDSLQSLVGLGQTVIFPALFDSLNPNLNLVGFIDVRTWIENNGSYIFDSNNIQNFNFVNGASSQLPGFIVASTNDQDAFFDDVIEFNEGIGFNIIDPNASLYTGTAVSLGEIGVYAQVPESSSAIGLISMGTLGLLSRFKFLSSRHLSD
jgi:hypothetical protein